jgi:VIT1/CCC1 family predicted Fe2+/Mn2+ transporter
LTGTGKGATVRALSDENRIGAILGAADGLGLAVSLIFGRNTGIFHAALDDGIGEFVSMAAALYLASKKRELMPAILCGAATFFGCFLPAIPYLFANGIVALIPAVIITALLGAVICELRPEKGWVAVAETYGVLLIAGSLCFAASL